MSGPIRPPLRVKEVDGSPSVIPVNTIRVTDGTLTDNGGATVTIATGSGGGGSMTSFDVAGNTGPSQTVSDGETLNLIGGSSGNDIKVTMSASDTATIDLQSTGVTAASYTNANITVDANGRLTAASSGSSAPSGANPSATISGSAVDGTATTFMRSDAAPALADTTVTAASYTYTALTVDAQGRITAASSGTAPSDTTYDLKAATSGSDAEIQLDASAGTDTAVKLAAGSNITLTESGGDTITIAASSGSSGTVESVGLTETGTALTITGSPVTTSGTINIAGAGTSSQVILGDLSLATLPTGVTFPLEGTDGTAAAPTYSFSSDTNNGMYLAGTDTLGLSSGGLAKITISGAAVKIESNMRLSISDGAVDNPGMRFGDDTNTGIFRSGSDSIGIASGASEVMTIGGASITQTLKMFGPDGGAGNPTFGFKDDTDTGIYRPATGQIGLSMNGSNKLTFGAAGEILIAGTTAGTSGQVLTSGGSGSAMSWADASGGGGSGFVQPHVGTGSFLGSYNAYPAFSSPFSTKGNEDSMTSTDFDTHPFFRPFLLAEGGTWGGIEIKVTSASGSNAVLVALYNTDSTTGMPTSFVGYCDVATNAVGNIAQTTTLDSSGSSATITLSANTQYWIAIVAKAGSDSCSLKCIDQEHLSTFASSNIQNLPTAIQCTFVSNDIETNNPPRLVNPIGRDYPAIGVIV